MKQKCAETRQNTWFKLFTLFVSAYQEKTFQTDRQTIRMTDQLTDSYTVVCLRLRMLFSTTQFASQKSEEDQIGFLL